MAIFCATDAHWPLLCRLMGQEALLADDRFANTVGRAQYMEEIDALVSAWSQQFTRNDLTAILNEAGVPCGPVLTLDEVADDPHLKQRQMIIDLDHPLKGPIKVIGCPLKFYSEDGVLEFDVLPAPAIGQHNDEVYTSLLNYSAADLDRFRAAGVI
jgi:crotonobetainyl-CoA:carnitine CoA-transferase CaiB-like acyl-CoA transferase